MKGEGTSSAGNYSNVLKGSGVLALLGAVWYQTFGKGGGYKTHKRKRLGTWENCDLLIACSVGDLFAFYFYIVQQPSPAFTFMVT